MYILAYSMVIFLMFSGFGQNFHYIAESVEFLSINHNIMYFLSLICIYSEYLQTKNPLIRHFQWKICLLSGIFVQNSGIFVHNSVEYSSKIVEFLSVIVEFVSVTVENLSKSVEFLSMKKSQIPLFSRLFNLTTYYYILITIYYVN